MTDPVADAARSAAQILAGDLGPNLPAEVEAALHARGQDQQRPGQFLDPISLATLVVAVAQLAYSAYSDHRKHTGKPSQEAVERQVRNELREQDTTITPQTERITEVVVTVIIRQDIGEN